MDSTQPPRTDAPVLGEPLPIELMNTVWADRDGVHDALADADGLARWLRAVRPRLEPRSGEAGTAGGWDPDEGAALAARYRRLRDALRRLAAAATDDDRAAAVSPTPDVDAAVAVLNSACADAPTWSHLTWPEGGAPSRTDRSARPRSVTAMSRIAEDAIRLFAGEQRAQLRACHAPGCVLYFLRTHPRREWCSAACGNRARVARHYQRHLAADRDIP
ncbi:CGNR zinc finger domain-containing protein [Actinacidiphila alni]|uniref:CGNR zinc finger domain-containing protein n=1 Tax=Actinacidiphila alni TaxID=380248 RepID=UPI0034566831